MEPCRRHIAASNDALTFAVGDLDGVIHIYRWEANNLPSEMSSICYPRAYIVPRPVTFTFFHGARFLLVGSEEGEAIVLDLMIKARAASFQHPSTSLLLPAAQSAKRPCRRKLRSCSRGLSSSNENIERCSKYTL